MADTPTSDTQPKRENSHRSARTNCRAFWLAVYFGASLVLLFGINFWAESRIYKHLAELQKGCGGEKPDTYCSQLTTKLPPDANFQRFHLATQRFWVEIYRERYETLDLRTACTLGVSLLLIAVILGILIYRAESRSHEASSRWYRWIAVVAYWIMPCLVHWFIYSDFAGTVIISVIFLFMFFLMKEATSLNLHRNLVKGSAPDPRVTDVLRFYDRIFTLSLGAIAVVPLTFLVAANNIIESGYLVKELADTHVFYNAIHRTFFTALLFYSAFGCSVVGIGITGVMYSKIRETLRFEERQEGSLAARAGSSG